MKKLVTASRFPFTALAATSPSGGLVRRLLQPGQLDNWLMTVRWTWTGDRGGP
ncbi:MAG: hypothetical protein IPG92_13320 [Flavobacteriales bacterium]|nr:hypothetical protein [Flavobacteriales bacterium]